MKLQNKNVIITGASSGLGECLAYKVAEEGARVALVARSEEKLSQIQKKIVSSGGKAEVFVCDIRNYQEVKKTTSKIFSKLNTIDILVNNAGVWTDNELEKEKPEMRKIAFDTNALGNIQFTNAILPYFQEKNIGYIFNVISTSGVADIPAGDNTFWMTYGATKWAVAGFTKDLRNTLKDTQIKVTGFFPGGFESNLYEKAQRKNPHNQPWMMKTEDVADIIIFALTRPTDVLMERIIVTKIMESVGV